MHLVLALLGALRAGLGARTDLVLENLALATRPVPSPLEAPSVRPPRSTLLDMALAAVGAVARDAQCGSPRDRNSLAQAGLPRILELEVPARPNRETTRRLGDRKARPHHGPRQSGERRASMASSSSSVSTFHNARLVGSCLVARNRPRRPGEPSSRTTSLISSPSTSSWCPR